MKQPYDFGLLLRRLRKEKGMTQQQLADRLNVSVTTVSKYESNNASPPMETLRTLAVTLNVSMDELCGTQSRGTVSLYGLSETQAKIIQNLTLEFRQHNMGTKKSLSQEQCNILGSIVAEFAK